jgi:hypothetical protein
VDLEVEMTAHSVRPLPEARALAVATSFLSVSLQPAPEWLAHGKTLAWLRHALGRYCAAGQSVELQERLQNQRELADALDAATEVLQHNQIESASAARRAIATIRVGLAGNGVYLRLGAAMLDAAVGHASPPSDSGLPLADELDAPTVLRTMVWNVHALNDAIATNDAEGALAAQAELLTGARFIEFTFPYLAPTAGGRVRAALDDLRVGLAGDSRRLKEATNVFDALADWAQRRAAEGVRRVSDR